MPDGDDLRIGRDNTGTATTRLTRDGDALNTAYEVINQNGSGILGRGQAASGYPPNFPYGVWGDSAGGFGVYGTSTSNYGVWGASDDDAGVRATSVNGTGVVAAGGRRGLYAFSLNGTGVHGNSFSGRGVHGESTNSYGVHGTSTNSYGVHGTSTNSYGMLGESTNTDGVVGRSSGAGRGVVGESNTNYGVVGTSNFSNGVYGVSDARNGVFGRSRSATASGVYGENNSGGFGVAGRSGGGTTTTSGVYGENNGGGPAVLGRSLNYPAVYGEGPTNVAWPGIGGTGRRDNAAGVVGWGNPNFQNTIGIHGISGPGPKALAALFEGKTCTRGTIIKRGGGTQIDHPLDPENKYLNHFFVESDEMKNAYDGVAQLNEDGTAWVKLPEWFEAYNRDYRYQLTAIGGPAPELHIAEEISDNWFRIAGGKEGLKVSWQVTGVRQDRWAEANPVVVEEEKDDEDQGRYLYPELYDAPQEQRVVGPLSEIPEAPAISPEPPEDTQRVDELGRPIEQQRRQMEGQEEEEPPEVT